MTRKTKDSKNPGSGERIQLHWDEEETSTRDLAGLREEAAKREEVFVLSVDIRTKEMF